MSLARAISRGFFLKARFGVNGTKNASRSFVTVGASGRVASDISSLQRTAFRALTAAISANRGPAKCRPANQHGIAVARRALLRRRLYRMLMRTDSSIASMAQSQSARENLHYELKIVLSAQV